MKKAILKTMYNLGAFAPFRRLTRDRLLVLMYHRFCGAEKNAFKTSAENFAAHLEYLKKYHRVLPLAEAVEYLKNGKSLPPNSAVITIDDGYRDAYEIAFPLLKKHALPATVYVVTDFADEKCWLWTDLMRYVLLQTENDSIEIEFENQDKIKADLNGSQTRRLELAARINSRLKKLPNEKKTLKIEEIAAHLNVEIPARPTEDYAPVSWEQAREMDASGVVKIESHTVTHPILTNISSKDLDFELRASKNRLEEVLDRRVEMFCYPNGSFNSAISRAVEDAGYTCATTTDYGFNSKGANLFLLNRIDAQSSLENFAQSASGFEAMRRRIRN